MRAAAAPRRAGRTVPGGRRGVPAAAAERRVARQAWRQPADVPHVRSTTTGSAPRFGNLPEGMEG